VGVRAREDQSGGDEVLAVLVQEIRDRHPTSVREVAGRWEQGLRGLFALTGVSGLVGAPLAVERLAGPTQAAVGVLLAVVLSTAGAGLVLTMSAAYGSVRLLQVPGTATALEQLRWSRAERDRRHFLWGRRLAVAALGLFAVSVAVAWVDPADSTSHLQVATDEVTYCGAVLDAARGTIAVHSDLEGRVEVPAAEVSAIDIVENCDEGDEP
jgi:hypothetical protein